MNIQKQNKPGQQKPNLKKVLGVFDGMGVLIGITIGAGIYSTPQIIAGYMGSFKSIIFLWVVVGIFIFIGGLIYAELGTRLPYTGGEYVYISQCYGPYAGFMFGWAQLFIIRTYAGAGLALISADYIGYLVKLNRITHTIVALAIIAFLGALNYVGIKQASVFQKIAIILKTGGLFAIVALGIILIQGQENLLSTSSSPTGNLGPVGNTIAALMLIVFAHTGWDRVGYVAGEMKNPRRAIPLSLIFGLGIVIVLYVFANIIYHRTLGMEGMRSSTIVASDVAVRLIGPIGAGFIALLVIISSTSSINGTIMSAPRAYYAMAKDGLFFKWFDFVHPKFHTPSHAIIAHCVWSSFILLVRGTFETIASGLVFALLIFLTFNTIALFKLRKKEVGGEDIFRVPLYPFLPLLYLLGVLALLVSRAIFEWEKSLIDMAFIATGLPFSFFWCRKKKRETKHETQK